MAVEEMPGVHPDRVSCWEGGWNLDSCHSPDLCGLSSSVPIDGAPSLSSSPPISPGTSPWPEDSLDKSTFPAVVLSEVRDRVATDGRRLHKDDGCSCRGKSEWALCNEEGAVNLTPVDWLAGKCKSLCFVDSGKTDLKSDVPTVVPSCA